MKITLCGCASRTFIELDKIARVAALLSKAGHEVELVSDLCELCEDKDEKVHGIAKTTIVACHDRAVKSIMAFAGEDGCRSVDMRSLSADEVMKQLDVETAVDNEEISFWKEKLAAFHPKQGEDAWYPAIDKDMCAECGKCFEFCPFGVYEMVDDRVRVVHPHNCKNNCPACARMCPAGAIIFAKYEKSPINGGQEQEEKTGAAIDTKQMYAEALREKLKARRRPPLTPP